MFNDLRTLLRKKSVYINKSSKSTFEKVKNKAINISKDAPKTKNFEILLEWNKAKADIRDINSGYAKPFGVKERPFNLGKPIK
jgi:predicted Zn-dependent protease